MSNLILGLLLITLTGCSTFGDRAEEVRVSANRCTGMITLSVQKKGEDEIMRYECKWNNELSDFKGL